MLPAVRRTMLSKTEAAVPATLLEQRFVGYCSEPRESEPRYLLIRNHSITLKQ